METKFKTAFETWLCITFEKNTIDIAKYLFSMVKNGCPSDSMVWEMLAETNDSEYTFETFLKAARKIILD